MNGNDIVSRIIVIFLLLMGFLMMYDRHWLTSGILIILISYEIYDIWKA